MRLKGDVRLRRRFYASEAARHPAKGHLGLMHEEVLVFIRKA